MVLMVVDLAVAQLGEEALDFLVADGFTQADAVNVAYGNQHRGVVGHDTEMKEPAGCTKNRLLFDPFDDAKTVVRVDDLVADLECHVSPVAGSGGRTGVAPGTALTSIDHMPHRTQREMPEKRPFSALQPGLPPTRRASDRVITTRSAVP
jgi:hypothetical protein